MNEDERLIEHLNEMRSYIFDKLDELSNQFSEEDLMNLMATLISDVIAMFILGITHNKEGSIDVKKDLHTILDASISKANQLREEVDI